VAFALAVTCVLVEGTALASNIAVHFKKEGVASVLGTFSHNASRDLPNLNVKAVCSVEHMFVR
jgi:hypothetical protein